MQGQAQGVISLFRTIVLAGVAGLLVTSAVVPAPAQDSVPPTARQAVTMQRFAAKLAHGASRISQPTPPRASYKNPADAFAPTNRGWLPQGGVIYDNGPINGTSDAWTINFGFVVSDTIAVGSGTVSGMTFGAWVYPGDILESVEISITSSEFGGTSYFDGVVSFTQSGCNANQYGFNVCTATSANFSGPNLAAGTYWVNLQNAQVNTGDPLYWDENSGVGCTSNGCPSLASVNTVGTIPSESFQVLGSGGSPTCFEPGGNLQVLHNFDQQQAGSYSQNGVTIDNAGNLYGTTPNGGDYSAGFAFKLARFAGWVLDPLFNFFGGNNGGVPTGAIIGPNGTLYGGAQGGIQNCGSDGSQYCGLVYNLTPKPTVCLTSLCGWNENVPYRFSSESDGAGVVNVSASDQQGNLYGTTSAGGAHDAGTVFKLTPSGLGWTKTTLYSFTGGADGGDPTQVLVGNDGNLYGVANGNGVVFQLTPSGGQWTESVVYAFGGSTGPAYLVQDNAGNLYGILTTFDGPMFTLQKASPGWKLSEYLPLHGCSPGDLPYAYVTNLTIDAAGNVYGTGGGGETFAGGFGKKSPGEGTCIYNYIFKARYDGTLWQYQDLYFRTNTYFPGGGTLALDASGNLYGTTDGCGTNGYGTVWQVSP